MSVISGAGNCLGRKRLGIYVRGCTLNLWVSRQVSVVNIALPIQSFGGPSFITSSRRPYILQGQYSYVFRTLLEEHLYGDTEVDANDLRDQVFKDTTIRRLLNQQFQVSAGSHLSFTHCY